VKYVAKFCVVVPVLDNVVYQGVQNW